MAMESFDITGCPALWRWPKIHIDQPMKFVYYFSLTNITMAKTFLPDNLRTNKIMSSFYIFIARLILGMMFGVLLTKIFRPDWSMMHGFSMGVLLVAAAYLMQVMRNRKTR